MTTPAPSQLLRDALARAQTCACVGLDPDLEKLPREALDAAPSDARRVEAFSRGVLESVARAGLSIVKPQSACYERLGSAGVAALEGTIARARELGLFVILDAKRGDIGVSARHYAAAAAQMGAHAVTLSGYLGPSTIEPYIDAGLLVFVLVRTSNPDSDRVQAHTLASGESVAEMMARIVHELGVSRHQPGMVGAVVGATKPQDGPRLREIMPDAPILVPGFGAQGGTVQDVRGLVRHGATTPADAGVIVTASRSVIYPTARAGETWTSGIERAAGDLREQLRPLLA